MPRALLGLGANLGDGRAQLDAATDALAQHVGIQLIAHSAWRETRPIGGPANQPRYVNGAALLETSLAPHALWREMSDIETSAGRERHERWGPRTLDLDLLLYDEQVIDDAVLTVPHPRLALRRFVLEPAAEIAATMRHPVLDRTLGELAHHVAVTRSYAAIIGRSSVARRELAAQIAQLMQAVVVEFPENGSAPAQLRAMAASAQPAQASSWLVAASWSEQSFLMGTQPLDRHVELSLLQRLLIAVQDGASRLDTRPWPTALRQRVGPIVYVEGGDPAVAAEQAVLAMQGLSNPAPE